MGSPLPLQEQIRIIIQVRIIIPKIGRLQLYNHVGAMAFLE